MSYHVYTTSGIVLGSSHLREGDVLATLFTREFGMIRALAKSAREERSKLRYGLQDFSRGDFSLVHGREFWRITSVALSENLWSAFHGSPETAGMFSRVFRLLKRLLPGEGPAEPLFDALVETVAFLKKKPDSKSFVADAEVVLLLRVLHLLGYLAPRGELEVCLSDYLLWNDDILSRAAAFRTLAIADINQSLKESQL